MTTLDDTGKFNKGHLDELKGTCGKNCNYLTRYYLEEFKLFHISSGTVTGSNWTSWNWNEKSH